MCFQSFEKKKNYHNNSHIIFQGLLKLDIGGIFHILQMKSLVGVEALKDLAVVWNFSTADIRAPDNSQVFCPESEERPKNKIRFE